jgi:hypothetical protein
MWLMILQRQYLKNHNCYIGIKELWRPRCAGYVALALVTWRLVPMAAGSSASHIACMVAKTPKRRKASNPLASAVARWENEGGASGPASALSRDKPVLLSEDEGRILQCLGAAVLLQWNDLPAPIQRQLFEHAISMGEAGQTAKLKEQIARFLHTHKDDERESE